MFHIKNSVSILDCFSATMSVFLDLNTEIIASIVRENGIVQAPLVCKATNFMLSKRDILNAYITCKLELWAATAKFDGLNMVTDACDMMLPCLSMIPDNDPALFRSSVSAMFNILEKKVCDRITKPRVTGQIRTIKIGILYKLISIGNIALAKVMWNEFVPEFFDSYAPFNVPKEVQCSYILRQILLESDGVPEVIHTKLYGVCELFAEQLKVDIGTVVRTVVVPFIVEKGQHLAKNKLTIQLVHALRKLGISYKFMFWSIVRRAFPKRYRKKMISVSRAIFNMITNEELLEFPPTLHAIELTFDGDVSLYHDRCRQCSELRLVRDRPMTHEMVECGVNIKIIVMARGDVVAVADDEGMFFV